MNNFGEKVTFIWSVADLLRDSFKRSKYPDVILPFTVLRRIDCVLEPTKPKVLEAHAKLKDKLDNLAPQLRRASGYSFYNTSPFTFESLCGDAKNLAANLKNYINSFSDNMREVVEKFDFQNTIGKLDDAGLLFLVTERFKNIDLHPGVVSNLEMGYVFEELIRKFNEAMDENPGEHFTPREVIRLMVNLLLTRDREALAEKHIVRTVYDCCCGSGGMLTIAKDRIVEINPNADVHLFGQEVNPETFAVAKSDLFMKSADGRDAENIKFGSTLGKDQHADKTFDYLLTNPPFGKEWKMDQKAVGEEYKRGYAGRFGAGLPRVSDGQLLFLQHLLGRMKEPTEGGSRVAIVMNGSPLFTGDAAGGESEIRRWILENDWLEAIVALPEQLFYNTGIPTYVWVLTNRKPKLRKGKVQLIDATAVWTPVRKSLGDKRREISPEQIGEITRVFETFREGSQCRIFKTSDFGYRKVTVERPLRLNFQASPERIGRIVHEKAVVDLATSKKKGKAGEEEIEAGRKLREAILAAVKTIDPAEVWKNRTDFSTVVDKTLVGTGKVPVAVKRAIVSALSRRDETADICTDDNGNPEPDSDLRDTENVPLLEDVTVYFEREVSPHVPDAWVNTGVRDHKDGEVGKIGYEINFNRYFYQYQPPRDLEVIEDDIKGLEKDIVAMLRVVTGMTTTANVNGGVRRWRRYKDYTPSGVPWLGSLPSEWTLKPLGRVVCIVGGMTPSKENAGYWAGPIPWVSPKDMKRWELDGSEDHISEEAVRTTGIQIIEPNAVLIVVRGMILAKDFPVAINRIAVTINQDMKALIPKHYLVATYLAYQLRAIREAFFAVVEESGHGTKCLRTDLWKTIACVLPPHDEQHRIVSFLDREMANLDALIAGLPASPSGGGTLARMVRLLQEYRTALVAAAVTGQIDVREEAV